jgi:hypothetical protein
MICVANNEVMFMVSAVLEVMGPFCFGELLHILPSSSPYHPFIIKKLIFIKKSTLMSHQRQLFNKNQFF